MSDQANFYSCCSFFNLITLCVVINQEYIVTYRWIFVCTYEYFTKKLNWQNNFFFLLLNRFYVIKWPKTNTFCFVRKMSSKIENCFLRKLKMLSHLSFGTVSFFIFVIVRPWNERVQLNSFTRSKFNKKELSS